MKKLFTTISAILFSAALTGAIVNAPFNAHTASAETEAESPAKSESLVLPDSYEEYLPLSEPSSASVSVNYTAIADGNAIYVFDRTANEYKKYEHTPNDTSKPAVITKLEFSEDGDLYFLDSTTDLYKLSPKTLTAENMNFSCSSFTLYGKTIYFLRISESRSQIWKTTLDGLSTSKESVAEDLGANPPFTVFDGNLYYIAKIKSVSHLYQHGVDKSLYEFDFSVASLALSGNLLVCVDDSGNLRVYDYLSLIDSEKGATIEPLFKDESGEYSSLSVFGDYLYAVKGNAIKRFSVKDIAFTDFEISSDSASKNRLSGATDLHLSGNRLYIADENNRRVSVYDTESKTALDPIALPEDFTGASYLASTADSVLIASDTTALLYSVNNAEAPLITLQSFNGKLVGATAVGSAYYFITDAGDYYRLPTDGETYELESATKKNSVAITHQLSLLTSDVYGNLYIGAGSEVYRFTETEFMNEANSGTSVLSDLPVNATKLLVDYEQTVYALSEGELLRFSEERKTFELAKSLVYSQGADTPVSSFAFGIEENQTYLLYDGNLIVATDELALPTVKTIPVNKADESIFAQAEAVFSVVTVKEKTLIVQFDTALLSGAEHFPYLSHFLTTEPLTALKIGETEKYTVLALLNKSTNAYETYLALNAQCEKLDESEYLTTYETGKAGYLSNAVKLYKFPYLSSLLTVSELTKSAEVTVLGEVKFDYDYYRVSVKTADGEITGYIPKPYVNDFDGAPQTPKNKVLGDESTDDAIARLAFLLLGLAAVCILVDFLLLRKKPDDSEE